MLVRAWHGFLALIAVLAIPGLIVGLWLGVLETGLAVFMLIVAALGALANVRAFFFAHKDETEAPLGVVIIVGWFFLSIAAMPFGVGASVWYDLNSPFAYQFDRDYPVAHYVDPNGRFELDYPADLALITPAEARTQFADRLTVSPAAVLFVGTAPDWIENVNIQMSPASYRNGEIVGDDEDELLQVGSALRKALQQQYPDASVDRFSVDEEGDRVLFRIGMRRYGETGLRVAQHMTMVVMDGQQVTFTTTSLPETAAGLNRYRFATIIDSFRVLEDGR